MLSIPVLNLIIIEILEPLQMKTGNTLNLMKVKDFGKEEYIVGYTDNDLYTSEELHQGDIINCTLKITNKTMTTPNTDKSFNSVTYYLGNIVLIGQVPDLNTLPNKSLRRKYGGKDYSNQYKKHKEAEYMNIDEAFNENADTEHFKQENKQEDYPDWMKDI